MQWYRRAAEQGNADAQHNLGVMYRKRHAAARPYPGFEAVVQQLRLGAELRNAWAQGQLGQMYARGIRVPKNYVYAHMWANIAASGGSKDAVILLNLLKKEMTLSQITEAQKLARECIRKEYKNCEY